MGSISCALYVYFFKLAGPVPATLLVILLGLGAVGLQIAADKFLSSWSVVAISIGLFTQAKLV